MRFNRLLSQLLILVSLLFAQNQFLLHQLDHDAHSTDTACEQCLLLSDLGKPIPNLSAFLLENVNNQSIGCFQLYSHEAVAENYLIKSIPRAPPVS